MAFKAQLAHGDPVFADYTPGAGAVNAGDIVLLGNTTGLTCGVAHQDIANNVLGTLAIGRGIYNIKVASNYAAWTKVYWDNANSVLTTTSTNMALFGYTLQAAAAANAIVEVLHQPFA
jgi:predicted RecA/RadA family phage recombinase